MPNYRQRRQANSYFFTLVSMGRHPIFSNDAVRQLLSHAIRKTQQERPWTIEGMVLLPDHLHTLWRLPDGDTDYSSRIAALKKRFTRAYLAAGGDEASIPTGQRRHRRRGVWQQRFWEHEIRDAKDFRLHLDYIHGNPVKHGLVARPIDWPYSSFHRHVEAGMYESDWCGRTDLPGNVEYIWPE